MEVWVIAGLGAGLLSIGLLCLATSLVLTAPKQPILVGLAIAAVSAIPAAAVVGSFAIASAAGAEALLVNRYWVLFALIFALGAIPVVALISIWAVRPPVANRGGV